MNHSLYFDYKALPKELTAHPQTAGDIALMKDGFLIGIEYPLGKREWLNTEGKRSDYFAENGEIYPAVQWRNGSYQRYKDGALHSSNGPAICWKFTTGATFSYYQEGQLHRVDGPAKISKDELSWYFEGSHIRSRYPEGRVEEYYQNKITRSYVLDKNGKVIPKLPLVIPQEYQTSNEIS